MIRPTFQTPTSQLTLMAPTLLGILFLVTIVSLSGSWLPDALSCGEQKPQGALYVVLVDASMSRSEEDWAVYRTTLDGVLDSYRAGDRVILGLISAHTLRDFRPVIDRESRKTGRHLNDQEQAARDTTEVLAAFESISSVPLQQQTRLLEGMGLAAELCVGDRRHGSKCVLILSDMIEDSPEANFAKTALTPEYVESLITRRKEAHVLPDLSGIRVYVSGAKAPDDRKYQEIKDFWMTYFKATGAICEPGMYARSALQID